MKFLTVLTISIKECVRRRIVYGIFAMAILLVVLGRGCNPGTLRGERLLIDERARTTIAASAAFHVTALWSFLLCSLLAAGMLARELEDGTAALTFSRPVRRSVFIAGKLAAAFALSVVNIALLGALLYLFLCRGAGSGLLTGLACMIPVLLICTLMNGCLSLALPRMIAPLLSGLVYATACWTALPFYYDKLRLLWIPSATVSRLYQFFPCFGDWQFIGEGFLRGTGAGEHLAGALFSTAVYCLMFWMATIVLFERRLMS